MTSGALAPRVSRVSRGSVLRSEQADFPNDAGAPAPRGGTGSWDGKYQRPMLAPPAGIVIWRCANGSADRIFYK